MRVNLPFGGRDITALLAQALRSEAKVEGSKNTASTDKLFALAAEGDILNATTVTTEGFKVANRIKEEYIRVSKSRNAYEDHTANIEVE